MSRYQNDLPNPVEEITKCRNFLLNFTDPIHGRKYMDQLQEISNRQRKLLSIELDDILQMNDDQVFVSNIQRNTIRYLRYFEEEADKLLPAPTIVLRDNDVIDVLENQRLDALQRAAGPNQQQAIVSSDLPKSLLRRYDVVIIPQDTQRAKKLREVKADDIGHLVTIKGLVTRISDVKPRVSVCTYTCDVCGSEIFQDVTGNSFMPIQKCMSQRCQDNKTSGKIILQTRGSRFMKYQELRIQELPDQVPVGHIPRSMTVHCSGELTRQCAPGDVITLSGVFLTVKYTGYRAITAGLQADTFLEAFSIQKQKLNFSDILITSDESKIREIATDMDPYGRLARSIAPEIYGHDDVKKALLLQLVGGVSKDLPDGMKIRGDINILLMGDPGVAKSQLLKYIASVAPRGVYTTGKGSSGVGLTAAVVKDNVTGDLTLEGGALVLADKGICCIDEFDKMDEYDRTAIHEVMEQQTISIAKAGITTSLNARAAVLAAANPLYGRYNIKKSISENVDLPNSLLSRFDLLFLLLDKADVERDTALSKHVLNVHKNPHTSAASSSSGSANSAVSVNYLAPEVFKQYIAAARSLNPSIPKELTNYIVEAYVSMRQSDPSVGMQTRRSSDSANNQAVMTPRQLLSILRLSQALARLRLSDVTSHDDVDEAIRLTHASKASLMEALHGNNSGGAGYVSQDVMSQIITIINDFATTMGSSVLEYIQVEGMIVKKGYTVEQFNACLSEYQSLGVIDMDANKSRIMLIA